jgi:hypothetical protein
MSLYSFSGYGGGPYGEQPGGPFYSMPLSYYLNLLTSEYKTAPKLNAWLASELQFLQDVTDCIGSITGFYDLDYADGPQLDVDGAIAGVSRTVGFQPSGGVSPILDDDTYRLLIHATIAGNHWNGTQPALYPIWASLFPGGTLRLVDNQNMSCTIVLTGVFTSIIQDLITHGLIVPRPQGVLYNYVFGDLPLLGFDQNNAFIAGFDLGHFS